MENKKTNEDIIQETLLENIDHEMSKEEIVSRTNLPMDEVQRLLKIGIDNGVVNEITKDYIKYYKMSISNFVHLVSKK